MCVDLYLYIYICPYVAPNQYYCYYITYFVAVHANTIIELLQEDDRTVQLTIITTQSLLLSFSRHILLLGSCYYIKHTIYTMER